MTLILIRKYVPLSYFLGQCDPCFKCNIWMNKNALVHEEQWLFKNKQSSHAIRYYYKYTIQVEMMVSI